MLDQLLATLNARIRRFAESGDPSVVLDPAALTEAAGLWEAAQQPADGDPHAMSVDVLRALADLHFARYQVLPDGQGQEDLRTALGLFAMVANRAPDRVPDHIRSLLAAAQPEPPDKAEQLAVTGANAFSEYQRTGRPQVLDAALTAFRDAVAATSPGHPDHAMRLSSLGAVLRTRFERDGNGADLDDGIDAGRQAVDLTPPGRPGLAMCLTNLGVSLLSG